MVVKALVDFKDNAKGVQRLAGETFIVSKARFAEINAVGMEKINKPLVEEVKR